MTGDHPEATNDPCKSKWDLAIPTEMDLMDNRYFRYINEFDMGWA